jgi:hypothetical protein
MIDYLIISPDGDIERRNGILDMGTIQEVVGGDTIEELPEPLDLPVIVLAYENAKAEGMNANWLATSLIRQRIHPDDFIAGTVVVAGSPDDEGDLTSIDAETEVLIRSKAER